MTGNTTWLGFPDLIKVRLTDTWAVATGTLKIPDFKNKDYQPREYISCAILVEPGSVVYFDELNIVPKKKQRIDELICWTSPSPIRVKISSSLNTCTMNWNPETVTPGNCRGPNLGISTLF